MTDCKLTVTLLWIDHCYEPTRGMFSLWLIIGKEWISHVHARQKGFCLLNPTKDVPVGHLLVKSLTKAFEKLGIEVANEETADD